MDVRTKQDLVGVWHSDPTDKAGIEAMGRATLDFRPDDRLIYTIHGDAKDEIALLTYQVSRDKIITDQPSSPKREETRFEITSDGKLLVTYDGTTVRYVRITS